MVELPLYAGQRSDMYRLEIVALIDDIDEIAVLTASQCWRFTSRYITVGRNRDLYLHTFIAEQMGLVWSKATHLIDHKNRNVLDCQRNNLRIATFKESSRNRDARGTNRYHGVHAHSKGFQVKLANKHWKTFQSEMEAAIEREKEIIRRGDEFSIRNFPDGLPDEYWQA